MLGRRLALSLFWRTFILLGLLLAIGIVAWMQTLRALEFEPRAVQSARQIASLVNLSRAGLRHADAINRVALIKDLFDQESITLRPSELRDRYETFEQDTLTRKIASELRTRIGPESIVARSVNNVPGLWVRFPIENDLYWLRTDGKRLSALTDRTWFVWIGIAFLATLLGSIVIARLINKPLKELSFAASRIREGEYDSSLDESMMTREIREVNQGFNRMARELAKVEEDRAVMLAGISHDLRTPLARMRLETEMSVTDDEARRNMVSDIEQLDAIIDKFMDYARPGDVALVPVHVATVVNKAINPYRDTQRMRISCQLPIDTKLMADETELGRVLTNLLENAWRYGRDAETGITRVEVSYERVGSWGVVSVRDHGSGAAPDKLQELKTPFFRGDSARTAATGAGLGLAIVEKALQRMGGSFELANAAGGGLVAHIKLKRAP